MPTPKDIAVRIDKSIIKSIIYSQGALNFIPHYNHQSFREFISLLKTLAETPHRFTLVITLEEIQSLQQANLLQALLETIRSPTQQIKIDVRRMDFTATDSSAVRENLEHLLAIVKTSPAVTYILMTNQTEIAINDLTHALQHNDTHLFSN